MKIIITGASKGIGRGIATALAKHGHSLGLVARTESLLVDLKETLQSMNTICHIKPCDLRNPSKTYEAVTDLVERLNGIDAVINNAGIVIRKDVLKLSIEEWITLVETNINSVFFVTRAALPHLIDNKKGHVINISSISGKLPLKGGSGYAATKYAVTGFSESLFHEVRDLGIKVSTIFPGSVETKSFKDSQSSSSRWKVLPEEVGEACHEILNTSERNCISQLEISPLKRPS